MRYNLTGLVLTVRPIAGVDMDQVLNEVQAQIRATLPVSSICQLRPLNKYESVKVIDVSCFFEDEPDAGVDGD